MIMRPRLSLNYEFLFVFCVFGLIILLLCLVFVE